MILVPVQDAHVRCLGPHREERVVGRRKDVQAVGGNRPRGDEAVEQGDVSGLEAGGRKILRRDVRKADTRQDAAHAAHLVREAGVGRDQHEPQVAPRGDPDQGPVVHGQGIVGFQRDVQPARAVEPAQRERPGLARGQAERLLEHGPAVQAGVQRGRLAARRVVAHQHVRTGFGSILKRGLRHVDRGHGHVVVGLAHAVPRERPAFGRTLRGCRQVREYVDARLPARPVALQHGEFNARAEVRAGVERAQGVQLVQRQAMLGRETAEYRRTRGHADQHDLVQRGRGAHHVPGQIEGRVEARPPVFARLHTGRPVDDQHVAAPMRLGNAACPIRMQEPADQQHQQQGLKIEERIGPEAARAHAVFGHRVPEQKAGHLDPRPRLAAQIEQDQHAQHRQQRQCGRIVHPHAAPVSAA